MKYLFFIPIFFIWNCASFFKIREEDKNIQNQTTPKQEGCSFGAEMYQRLETILSTDITTTEDDDIGEIEDPSDNPTTVFRHVVLDKTGDCTVKSNLDVKRTKKNSRKYILKVVIIESNSSSKARYKELFTITTNSPKELLEKTRNLFAEQEQ